MITLITSDKGYDGVGEPHCPNPRHTDCTSTASTSRSMCSRKPARLNCGELLLFIRVEHMSEKPLR